MLSTFHATFAKTTPTVKQSSSVHKSGCQVKNWIHIDLKETEYSNIRDFIAFSNTCGTMKLSVCQKEAVNVQLYVLQQASCYLHYSPSQMLHPV